jgi:hypothetical protein
MSEYPSGFGIAEPTPEMIAAGKRALDRSGILENGLFHVHIDDAVIRSVFRAMMLALEASPQNSAAVQLRV